MWKQSSPPIMKKERNCGELINPEIQILKETVGNPLTR